MSRSKSVSSLSELLKVTEAAENLRVSTRTVRRLIKSWKLPVHRVESQVRISQVALRHYLMGQK